MVDQVLDRISDSLVAGSEVKLSNFGSFKLRDKPERMGRNPKNNQPAKISARRVITFRPSRKLKDAVQTGNAN